MLKLSVICGQKPPTFALPNLSTLMTALACEDFFYFIMIDNLGAAPATIVLRRCGSVLSPQGLNKNTGSCISLLLPSVLLRSFDCKQTFPKETHVAVKSRDRVSKESFDCGENLAVHLAQCWHQSVNPSSN